MRSDGEREAGMTWPAPYRDGPTTTMGQLPSGPVRLPMMSVGRRQPDRHRRQ